MQTSRTIEDPATQFQAVQVTFGGRLMLAAGTEHEGEIVEMSPGSARVRSEARPLIGERIVAYVDHIGRIEGQAWMVEDEGFGMTVEASQRKRDKIAAQLTWFANRDELSLPEDRRHARLKPKEPDNRLVLPDGRSYACRIIDLSVSGAAIQIDVRPARGTLVTLGTMKGRVARHFDGGVAIEFSQLLPEGGL